MQCESAIAAMNNPSTAHVMDDIVMSEWKCVDMQLAHCSSRWSNVTQERVEFIKDQPRLSQDEGNLSITAGGSRYACL